MLYNQLRQSNLNEVANGPFGPGVFGYLSDPGFPGSTSRRRKPTVAAYKKQTGQTLAFTLSIPNDAASQASAQVRRRHDVEGGHEGLVQAGRAVAGDQRRHRR